MKRSAPRSEGLTGAGRIAKPHSPVSFLDPEMLIDGIRQIHPDDDGLANGPGIE